MALPPLHRARSTAGIAVDAHVPFSEVAHLKSSFASVAVLARTHPKALRLPKTDSLKAKRELLRKLEGVLEHAVSEEQRARIQSEEDMDLCDFHRQRAKIAEENIAQIVNQPLEEEEASPTSLRGSHHSTWSPSAGKWVCGSPPIRSKHYSGADALASSCSAPSFASSSASSAKHTQLHASPLKINPLEQPCEEDIRDFIRSELIQVSGGPREAFCCLDLSGSGHVSFQEFSAGLARLGIEWQEFSGLRRELDIFKLFDLDKRGFLTPRSIFPPMQGAATRMSTPDLWGQWCRGTRDVAQVKAPRWQAGRDEGLQTLFAAAEARQGISDKRRWISATMRRLKHQGKSDARCREVCATHLPKGSGPKDREDVHTFSELEVKSCKRVYSDQVNGPVRNIQKTVYEMREQRRALQESRNMLANSISARQPALGESITEEVLQPSLARDLSRAFQQVA
jgi:hypothetical protein